MLRRAEEVLGLERLHRRCRKVNFQRKDWSAGLSGTTSIYRASLPIEEMVDWADGKVRFVESPLSLGTITRNRV
jgi:hypothetical protein